LVPIADSSAAAEALARTLAGKHPLFVEDLPCPPEARILVLAPHPDDFDAVAVTLRLFRNRGNEIFLSVMSPSSSGVEDSFCAPCTRENKAFVREQEQRTSCRIFGLPAHRLKFLGLREDESGHLHDGEDNYASLRTHLEGIRPDLVFMPHGNDSNPGHCAAFRMLQRFARQAHRLVAVFLNRDPKTLQMRPDAFTVFGEGEARWKAGLLQCHLSQHQRNLNTRGFGLDERILRVNRKDAALLPGSPVYAEAFEIWLPGTEQQNP
jgi:LmbE family N-acetylglucosaminyl deacetylase